MSVILKTPSNGSVTVSPADTASDVVVTVPARAGNLAVDGPAFSAYANGGQTLTNSTFTKIQCSTEQFDTNSNYDAATNFRFTPTVAGYYIFSTQASIISTVSITRIIPAIYKNGVAVAYGNDSTATATDRAVLTWLAYMNGSTDYVEFYAFAMGTGTLTASVDNGLGNFFQGFLARAA